MDYSNCHSAEPQTVNETESDTGTNLTTMLSTFSVTAKRAYDVIFSFCGLVLLSPLFFVVAVLIKLSDGGPVFFRQIRIGWRGRPFRICKFRTMLPTAGPAGPLVTKEGDARITWIGRILRTTKVDELPQLWNVLKGEMSLVGPRPEVPRFVEHYTPEQREILRLKPGITDLASLSFRDEESLLQHAGNLEEFYLQQCVPRKIKLNQEYARRANLLTDTWIILQTLCPYWIGVLLTHGVILAASLWLSFVLIRDFALPAPAGLEFWRRLLLVVGIQLGCLTWHRQCRALLSYFSLLELRQVATALGSATAVLLALSFVTTRLPARNVILLDGLLSVTAISVFRGGLRLWRENANPEDDTPAAPPVRVGIIGAGTTGAKLALDLAGHKGSGGVVVAFFDDDCLKWRKLIHGVPVIGMPECLLDGWAGRIDEVIIAVPNVSATRLRDIEQLLRKAGLNVHSVFRNTHIWNGRKAA